MTITVNLNPDAVWEDGTPITVADLECTWQAQLNTPGSIETVGYDVITAVTAGESDKQVIIEFSEPLRPVQDAVLQDHQGRLSSRTATTSRPTSRRTMPISGRQYVLQEWSESQSIMVAERELLGR